MRVLVTGASGFFGRGLCRALLEGGAERVVLFSRSESRQAAIAEQLHHFDAARFFLGDVRDRGRLEEAMWGCDTVVHAAALKQAVLVASDPGEVRKTNVVGSANVIAAALSARAKRVLMISSDKSVAASTFYGVSKAQMEHEAVASNAITAPRCLAISCTRWGNVLRSTGSVTELWRAQLQAGRPLTITDPSMTRFVITRRQAVDFCLASLAVMEGGEVFAPRLPAARLVDIAEATAVWAGPKLGLGGLAQTVTIGFRPGGEKHDEALVAPEEAARTWWAGDTMTVLPSYHPWRGVFLGPSGEKLLTHAYTSGQPDRWVGVDELVGMLAEPVDVVEAGGA